MDILGKSTKLVRHVVHKLRQKIFLMRSRRDQFRMIYLNGGFGESESLSGSGSNLEATTVVRGRLPGIIDEYQVKSMFDAPCGDWFWMRHVDLSDVNYIGGDIVDELISKNKINYSRNNVQFVTIDLVEGEIPKVDLILCRDCLIHLSNSDGVKAIKNMIASGSKYLLTTTFPMVHENIDLPSNFFRPINLEKPPFNLPAPLILINEECTEGQGKYADKSLALWDLNYL